MPYLTIADDVTFFYEDSGPVAGVNYTTLVFVHGMGFTGGVFKRLTEFASKGEFRIISLYRRDYDPSTKFGDADYALLKGGTEGQQKFLHQQGVQFALFLAKFISENKIKPAEASGGGVVPIGWSLGSVTIHALLSSLDLLPADVLEVLRKSVHTAVVHDLSSTSLGVPNPPEYNIDLWFEPDAQKRLLLFKDWAAGYYHHENIHSKQNKTLEFNKPSSKPATFHDLSEEELKPLTAVDPFGSSDTMTLYIPGDVARDEVRRALFDKTLAGLLPDLKVRYLQSSESPGVLLWVAWELQKALVDPSIYKGDKARDVKILYTPTGNHFIFYDQPELALAQYRRCISE